MLSPATTEAVLERLGFAAPPVTDTAGLAALYAAWCRHVPFDNLEKRIHLAAGDGTPFPNGTPEPFFASYLAHGTGGTCWPSSNALFALARACGFDARRGSAAMGDTDGTNVVASHGTVLADVDGARYWVDSSMLSGRVLPVRPGEATSVDDPVNPLRAEPVGDRWRVWWQFPVADGEMGCLLLDPDVDEAHYLARYEWSRENGPFNAGVYATRMFGDSKVTLARGHRFERTASGVTAAAVAGRTDRDRILVEEFGYSEEIVARLPDDDPAPVPS